MAEVDDVQIHQCACGFKVRYGPKHVGRTVRCRDCGEALTLPGPEPDEFFDDVPEPEPSFDSSEDYDLAPAEVKLPGMGPAALREQQAAPPGRASTRQANKEFRRTEILKRREGGFWGDAGRAFVFWMKPGNALTFLGLIIMLTAADFLAYIPVIGIISAVVITGMVWAFYFQVIVHSSGGDDDLPSPGDWEGVIESVIAPIFAVFCVTLAVALPALLATMFTRNLPLMIGMGALGAFLWPVAMLVAALAGPMAAFRLDALILTVVRAFLPYLAIWTLLVVAVGAQWLALAGGLGALPDAAYEFTDNLFFWSVVGNLSGSYTMIVMMTIIGLYYRHFSDHFPWDAG